MDTITFADKSTGDQLTAADVNEIKTVVNANAADKYNSITLPALSLFKDVSNPPSESAQNGTYVLAFADTADKCYFTFKLPGDYKEGTDIKLSANFTVGSPPASDDTVEANFNYRWANTGESFGASDSSIDAYKDITTGISVTENTEIFSNQITGTGKTIGSILNGSFLISQFVVADYINLISISLNYIVDGIGSTSETAK